MSAVTSFIRKCCPANCCPILWALAWPSAVLPRAMKPICSLEPRSEASVSWLLVLVREVVGTSLLQLSFCLGHKRTWPNLIEPNPLLPRVSLEDLYNGKTTKLQLSKNVLCSACNG